MNMKMAWLWGGVLACRDGRSICSIGPRRPSACSGICRLRRTRGTYCVDCAEEDVDGDEGGSEGVAA